MSSPAELPTAEEVFEQMYGLLQRLNMDVFHTYWDKKGFPVMPLPTGVLEQRRHPRLSHRERNRPRNGPSIDDWEAALLGRTLVKADTDEHVFKSLTKRARGSLGRLPDEIIATIEGSVDRSVSLTEKATACKHGVTARYSALDADRTRNKQTFKRSDLPPGTRFHPGGYAMNNITGRLNVVLGAESVVTRVYYA